MVWSWIFNGFRLASGIIVLPLVLRLFTPAEGRMGVTVTFVALLELMREGLIEVVQTEQLAPLHVRRASPVRTLQLVDNEPAGIEP